MAWLFENSKIKTKISINSFKYIIRFSIKCVYIMVKCSRLKSLKIEEWYTQNVGYT